MYEERRIRFDWKGFLIKLVIVIVLLLIIIKLLPIKTNKKQEGYTDIFERNIITLKEVGNNYFNKDNLPLELGESNTISLNQLIEENKIDKLKSSNGKTCDNEKSYIKATKKDIGYELEVFLKCDKEEDTSYVYLGCFDDCTNTTTTTTTKKKTTKKETTTKDTTKKKTNKSTTKSKSTTKRKSTTTSKSTTTTTTTTRHETTKKYTTRKYSTTRKTTTTTTTTTTIKRYAVIFNTNGGSTVKTQYIIKNNSATRPSDPTKTGYIFDGWELNGNIYDFSSPVTENIILKARWKIANQKSGVFNYYSANVYSVENVSTAHDNIKVTDILAIPNKIKNYKNIEILSVDYVRNINNQTDLRLYYDLKDTTFLNKSTTNKYDMSTFGRLNYINISHDGNNINWSAKVNEKCNSNINNTCNYGIIYNVIWKYQS